MSRRLTASFSSFLLNVKTAFSRWSDRFRSSAIRDSNSVDFRLSSISPSTSTWSNDSSNLRPSDWRRSHTRAYSIFHSCSIIASCAFIDEIRSSYSSRTAAIDAACVPPICTSSASTARVRAVSSSSTTTRIPHEIRVHAYIVRSGARSRSPLPRLCL